MTIIVAATPITPTSGHTVDGVMYGTTGADNVRGSRNDDFIVTGRGNDRVSAGAGDDVVLAGDGNDVVDGGIGNDVILGGAGRDILRGGVGDDVILGESGNDWLFGGSGRDVLLGGEGADRISGDSGDDILNGGSGRDVLDGGSGNDILIGGTQGDTFQFWIDNAQQLPNLRAAWGVDTIKDFSAREGDRIDMSTFWARFDDKVRLDFVKAVTATVNGGTDFGGYQTSTISTQGLTTNHYNWDRQTTDARETQISTIAGDASYAITLLYTARYNNDPGVLQINISANGANVPSDFRLFIEGVGPNTNWGNVFTADSQKVVHGTSGDDNLAPTTGNKGVQLYGFGGNDTLTGTGQSDILYGGIGNDTLNGGGARDSLFGGVGDDTLNGGEGNDDLMGEAGNDRLNGGSGNDRLFGDTGNNILDGGEGDDQFVIGVRVEAGTNELFFTGNNEITNYEAGDTVRLAINQSLDSFTSSYSRVNQTLTVTDGNSSTLTIKGVQRDEYLSLMDEIYGGDVDIGPTITSPVDTSVVVTDSGDILFGMSGNDTLTGGGKDDIIFGRDGNDTLNGVNGNDIIYGGVGGDTLAGGAGNDVLFGEAGNDRLVGGAGNDILDGGNGGDRFAFELGSSEVNLHQALGVDTIKNFSNDDFIDLSGFLSRLSSADQAAFANAVAHSVSGGAGSNGAGFTSGRVGLNDTSMSSNAYNWDSQNTALNLNGGANNYAITLLFNDKYQDDQAVLQINVSTNGVANSDFRLFVELEDNASTYNWNQVFGVGV